MDTTALIEQAIRQDIIQCRVNFSNQSRAIERMTRLRARVKRKANGEDNKLARMLDWHELSAKYRMKKDEEAIHTMERALEILQDYSFADDLSGTRSDDLSVALYDLLRSLKQLTNFNLVGVELLARAPLRGVPHARWRKFTGECGRGPCSRSAKH